ncbi:MAG: LLM class flavin-dependent oxidoreductase [Chloroflexota bacterium]|nr:LLM class flavin-dependent oxidoreductase [Chloroflexota bacterium]
MRQREVSVAFQSNKTAAEYAALARRVEEYGFDALGVYGDLMFQPPIGPLLLMAQATTRIRLGPASMNPYTIHPVEIAGQIAFLDAVSGGRAYLGLSRGAWLESLGIVQTKPVATMREAVGVVRHLLAKRRTSFAGDVFSLSEHNVLQYDVARADVPLMIGTWGPRLAALAGEVADEVKIGGCVNPAMVPVMRERIAVGARRAGRDADSVGIVLGAVTVVDEDGVAARWRAKEEVALYLPTVAGLDPTVSVDSELLARMETAVQRGDRQAAAALISDDLLRSFAFAGTPAEVIAHAEAIFAAGASRIEFGTPHGLTDARGVQLIGERVLPALRQ